MSKLTLLITLAILIFAGCDEDDPYPRDLTGTLKVSAFDHFTSVETGTYYNDSSKWLIAGQRTTNTALVFQSFFIYISKFALRQTDFPVTVQSADLIIQRHHWTDDPGGGPSRIDRYNKDVTFTIKNIVDDRLLASFSASTTDGQSITGEINWAPLNFLCPIGGQAGACPFDPSTFKVEIFSWTGSYSDPLAVDPNSASPWARFTLPVDTTYLKDHFVLLENGQTKVPGRYVVKFYRVDFFPIEPLKRNTNYTAKIIRGMPNSYNEKILEQDHTFELKTICGTSPVFENKLLVTGTSVEVGGETSEPGTWSVQAGDGGSFEDARKCPTIFHGTEGVIYTLQWRPDNGCPASKVIVDMRPLISDYEGNLYHETRIGDKIWMAENLRATYDAAGKPLGEVKSHGDVLVNGRHYPWYIVVNGEDVFSQSRVQGICPNGWHLPTLLQLQELIDHASTDGRPIDLVLKDSVTWTGLFDDHLPGLDLLNFRGVRSGVFEPPPSTWYRFQNALFWAKDRLPLSDNAYGLQLEPHEAVLRNFDIGTGGSVRCIKD